ncbi:MAG: hypothetical protein NVS9B1_02400 [Candidatus Dormibacteraceae bacterium]
MHVVPHTHWDREWYLPFAVYRRRLVDLIDGLLGALPREPGLRFHLDGQMAVVDDYLEARPDRLAAIRAAAAAGRVSLGPWYTLPDEHLVSGEALLRNLELGQSRAAELGEAMPIGYLPDQFGHTAQMPQILRLRGIDTAVVWRGVPEAGLGVAFTWEALDGTSVRAHHLQHGYGHGRALPLEPGDLAARLDAETWSPAGPWLVMAGDDHLPVPRGLDAALRVAGPARPAAISTLAAYDAVSAPAVGTWRGELLSAATSFILKGTLSARFPLKLEHAALERTVERHLEPILTLSDRPWPTAELGYIWRQLILNSAHDSICGCSLDQVHEEATLRIARAAGVAGRLFADLGVGEGSGQFFNPSPFVRHGIPPLGTGAPERFEVVVADPAPLRLELEDQPDRGDLYTFEPAGPPARRPPAGLSAERVGDEPLLRLLLDLENREPDHRIRLLFPADTRHGAEAGVAFGAVHRPFRRAGTEPGVEFDVRTDPAREWVFAGGIGIIIPGPFEYELLEDAIAVTLLRCVGWLSRDDLGNRPGHAGPGVATPDAQLIGHHHFELAVLPGAADHIEVARWADAFCHPLAPAPAGLAAPPALSGRPSEMISSLRMVGGRAQLRTYDLVTGRIEERLVLD